MQSRLDELGLKYGTDKASNAHNYLVLYEEHLPKKVDKFLEIGCWKGASIKMFKEYYNDEGQFYVMDVFGGEVMTIPELQALGIIAYEGSQSDINLLKIIKEQFDVISEDGSHHSDEQVITFKQMFLNNLKSGGIYIIEDVYGHIDPFWRRGRVLTPQDTIMGVVNKYFNEKSLVSQYISQEESDRLVDNIDWIKVYYDRIIFIKKK